MKSSQKRKKSGSKVRHVLLKKDDVRKAVAHFIDDKKSDIIQRYSNCIAKKHTLTERCIDGDFVTGPLPSSYTYIAMELRKCILHQDWTNATRLLLLFLPVAPRIMEPLIWRVCILILFHHPLSTDEIREDFVRMTTGMDQVEGVLQNILRLMEDHLPKV